MDKVVLTPNRAHSGFPKTDSIFPSPQFDANNSGQSPTPTASPSTSVATDRLGVYAQLADDFDNLVRPTPERVNAYPALYQKDIAFLLQHPLVAKLDTHLCMGVAHTETFKTADHTRFSPHTLYATELAMDMAVRLKLSREQALDLVTAVAMHDLGHIIASHQSEAAINSFPEYQGTPGNPNFCHEHRTKEILSSPEFVDHFGSARLERIKSILYNARDPLYPAADWSDRLAYLIADSLHIGDFRIAKLIDRQAFMDSLERTADGTIAFNDLTPAKNLVKARDILYRDVSKGPAAKLFEAFLIEAYHRAVEWNQVTPTAFVKRISELSTPDARKLFAPEDQPRLYCPHRHNALARPVDKDYIPVLHVTLDMLSPKGRQLALSGETVAIKDCALVCENERAGMSIFEYHIRKHLADRGGIGFAERIGALVAISHVEKKRYPFREVQKDGTIRSEVVEGIESWQMFGALPNARQSDATMINHAMTEALSRAGLLADHIVSAKNAKIGKTTSTEPSPSLFTKPSR